MRTAPGPWCDRMNVRRSRSGTGLPAATPCSPATCKASRMAPRTRAHASGSESPWDAISNSRQRATHFTPSNTITTVRLVPGVRSVPASMSSSSRDAVATPAVILPTYDSRTRFRGPTALPVYPRQSSPELYSPPCGRPRSKWQQPPKGATPDCPPVGGRTAPGRPPASPPTEPTRPSSNNSARHDTRPRDGSGQDLGSGRPNG